MLSRAVVSVALGVASAPSFAQAPGEVAPVAPLAPAPAPKDPLTARALSFGFTVSGLAMVWLGSQANSTTTAGIGVGMLYLGPATGHWYAGEVGGLGLSRAWNRKHGLVVGPTAMRSANGGTAPGVAFALRF